MQLVVVYKSSKNICRRWVFKDIWYIYITVLRVNNSNECACKIIQIKWFLLIIKSWRNVWMNLRGKLHFFARNINIVNLTPKCAYNFVIFNVQINNSAFYFIILIFIRFKVKSLNVTSMKLSFPFDQRSRTNDAYDWVLLVFRILSSFRYSLTLIVISIVINPCSYISYPHTLILRFSRVLLITW